jgi:hypothetical protein
MSSPVEVLASSPVSAGAVDRAGAVDSAGAVDRAGVLAMLPGAVVCGGDAAVAVRGVAVEEGVV